MLSLLIVVTGLRDYSAKRSKNGQSAWGCNEFASDVLLHNEAGQRAHEALGYTETERVVFYAKWLAR